MEGKVYRQFGINYEFDFCQLSKGVNSPIIEMALPGFRAQMGAAMHDCPYSVRFSNESKTFYASYAIAGSFFCKKLYGSCRKGQSFYTGWKKIQDSGDV
jgi:hypothetical protein